MWDVEMHTPNMPIYGVCVPVAEEVDPFEHICCPQCGESFAFTGQEVLVEWASESWDYGSELADELPHGISDEHVSKKLEHTEEP